MTGWACRSTPSGWNEDASSGRLRRTVRSSSLRRSSAICLKESIGVIRSERGGRKRLAGEPWPPAGSYRLQRDAGESLRGLVYRFGWVREADGGIMVTGSHIPFDRNGMKFYRAEGEISKEDEQRILAHELAEPAETPTAMPPFVHQVCLRATPVRSSDMSCLGVPFPLPGGWFG